MTGWETYWSKVASKPIGTAPNVVLASVPGKEHYHLILVILWRNGGQVKRYIYIERAKIVSRSFIDI